MLQARVAELVNSISAHSGQQIDLAAWVAYMALDFMGDFAFGGVLNLMEKGEDPEDLRKLGENFLGTAEALGTVPWSNALQTVTQLQLLLLMQCATSSQILRVTRDFEMNSTQP
jgi:hypothetical protein